MKENGVRICDVCAGEIPSGETYRLVIIAKDKMGAFLSMVPIDDPEQMPTWSQDNQGNITFDICLECSVSMGPYGGQEKVC